MKTPTQEQFQKVIDILSKAPVRSKIDMMSTTIANECGTPMCHGGWYLKLSGKIDDNDFNSYTEGAHLMAEDLGFKGRYELQDWASDNPKIWGNRNGRFMFSDGESFNRDTDHFTMQTIVNHWKKVKERALKTL